VQVVVHMIYFLHMNSKSEGGWNMMALILTIILLGFIVLTGSIWVMYHMNANMMPSMGTERAWPARHARHAMTTGAIRRQGAPRPRVVRSGHDRAAADRAVRRVWGPGRSSPAMETGLIERVEHACTRPGGAARSRRAGPVQKRPTNTAACGCRHYPLRIHDARAGLAELGIGYWLLTPLCTADGAIVIVNRGFIPAGPAAGAAIAPPRRRQSLCRRRRRRASSVRPAAHQRSSGGFLRDNDPAATAGTRATSPPSPPRAACRVAPFFVDAARRRTRSGAGPAGGRPDGHFLPTTTWCMLSLGMLWL
jgi:hypothetical protein